jgi:hypothetical protein
MKHLIFCLSIFILMSASITSMANVIPEPTAPGKPIPSVEVQVLIDRLKELKSVDRSNLTTREKKVLRKEIRSVTYQIDEPGSGGGLLISLAPLLVVITLIIIIL